MIRTILPTPYINNDLQPSSALFGVPTDQYAAFLWPSANRAIYVPLSVPADAKVYALWAQGGNSTGNYDLGFYAADGTRVANKGSTALSAAKLELLFDYELRAGLTYYMALALSSTSGSAFAYNPGSAARVAGQSIAQQASAIPMPTTMTPATPADPYVPLLAVGLR